MSDHLVAEHGVVCRLPHEKLGYFGWPTVARLDDGTLIVASSGLRSTHVCPWGKTVLNVSRDDGRTWSPPRVINDSPLDDRDAGACKNTIPRFPVTTRCRICGFILLQALALSTWAAIACW